MILFNLFKKLYNLKIVFNIIKLKINFNEKGL